MSTHFRCKQEREREKHRTQIVQWTMNIRKKKLYMYTPFQKLDENKHNCSFPSCIYVFLFASLDVFCQYISHSIHKPYTWLFVFVRNELNCFALLCLDVILGFFFLITMDLFIHSFGGRDRGKMARISSKITMRFEWFWVEIMNKKMVIHNRATADIECSKKLQ